MKRTELIKTRDGSHTLFIPELNEHYHSVHGAVSESLHVFIKNGWDAVKQKFSPIHLLEVGMGTGLNACLTFSHSQNIEIHYTALEPFPPEPEILNGLNYSQWIDHAIFTEIHASPFNQEKKISPSFHFRKLNTPIQDFQSPAHFNLVYFDAFAPHAQPELWTEDVFSKIFHLMVADAILVTYCAKGDVKRTLKKCGFVVEALPGAPGKREMTRAIKK